MSQTKYCCEEFAKECTEPPSLAGGIGLYAGIYERPTGQIEQCEDGTWSVNGCCGGCFVLSDIKFCPYCGTRLSQIKDVFKCS